MKEKKPYPVLYITSAKGSLFRSGSVNPTLYFQVLPDPERLESDPVYKGYYEEMTGKEIPQAIINKFVISQPLYLTNDRIPFLIFKSNIDAWSLEEFCRAILQEFSFHTGQRHSGLFGFDKTLLMEMNKKPGILGAVRGGVQGEKLTRSAAMDDFRQPFEFEEEMADQGIMCPLPAWKEEKRREAEAARALENDENEEVVLW